MLPKWASGLLKAKRTVLITDNSGMGPSQKQDGRIIFIESSEKIGKKKVDQPKSGLNCFSSRKIMSKS